MALLRVGTAGWDIPSSAGAHFPEHGTDLHRYACRFNAVEVNSTFYRLPTRQTLCSWVARTPPDFRFALRLPHSITHERPRGSAQLIGAFLRDIQPLAEKLGPMVIQLPRDAAFAETVEWMIGHLRAATSADLACAPLHASWFSPEADRTLAQARIARIAATGSPLAAATAGGGWLGLDYTRVGPGRPSAPPLPEGFEADAPSEIWRIFDNTAQGHEAARRMALEASRFDSPQAPEGRSVARRAGDDQAQEDGTQDVQKRHGDLLSILPSR